jgi:ElaA protein
MKVSFYQFNELKNQDLYSILRLRSEFFVIEQNCIYQDIDNKDQIALHVIGEVENKIVAYTRIFKSGDYFKNASIGRVIVKKSYRNKNYGKKIMDLSIKRIIKLKENTIELSAQKYLIKFYSDLGFCREGEEYLEDNIPHVKMKLKITSN